MCAPCFVALLVPPTEVHGFPRSPGPQELCKPKLLVMEWIAGCKITDVEALQRQVRGRETGRQPCTEALPCRSAADIT